MLCWRRRTHAYAPRPTSTPALRPSRTTGVFLRRTWRY